MKPKLILVVDDDPDTVRLITLELKAHNYDVISTSTGKDAIRSVVSNKPDLVILDYQIPEGDGVYVMTKLRTALETFTIPVIILTAYETRELRRQVFHLSARSFVSKPFKTQVLLEKVKEILGETGPPGG